MTRRRPLTVGLRVTDGFAFAIDASTLLIPFMLMELPWHEGMSSPFQKGSFQSFQMVALSKILRSGNWGGKIRATGFSSTGDRAGFTCQVFLSMNLRAIIVLMHRAPHHVGNWVSRLVKRCGCSLARFGSMLQSRGGELRGDDEQSAAIFS